MRNKRLFGFVGCIVATFTFGGTTAMAEETTSRYDACRGLSSTEAMKEKSDQVLKCLEAWKTESKNRDEGVSRLVSLMSGDTSIVVPLVRAVVQNVIETVHYREETESLGGKLVLGARNETLSFLGFGSYYSHVQGRVYAQLMTFFAQTEVLVTAWRNIPARDALVNEAAARIGKDVAVLSASVAFRVAAVFEPEHSLAAQRTMIWYVACNRNKDTPECKDDSVVRAFAKTAGIDCAMEWADEFACHIEVAWYVGFMNRRLLTRNGEELIHAYRAITRDIAVALNAPGLSENLESQ